MSANGRYVAFFADNDGLVASDTNERDDVFLRHLLPWQPDRRSPAE